MKKYQFFYRKRNLLNIIFRKRHIKILFSAEEYNFRLLTDKCQRGQFLPHPRRVLLCKFVSVHKKMGNSLSERDKNEAEFGEKIYEIVQQIYPESIANITGMLLELEHQELERLLTTTNQEELLARIHQAAKNMSSSDAPER